VSDGRIVAGIAGPAAFVATWSYLGARTSGYSPVQQPISHLAAARTPTQPMMTAGLVALGAGLAAYSGELRKALPGGAGTAALISAAASIGIAATPMESVVGGRPHVIAAGLTYASLAATPLIASRSLAPDHPRLATASAAAGVAAGACLAMSTISTTRTGMWQRMGLTIGHTWLVASAFAVALRRRDQASVAAAAPKPRFLAQSRN